MKALLLHDNGHAARLERNQPIPKLRDDQVLIKTVAVALNPADWKAMAWGLSSDGGLVGCDFSGIVEEVGPQVTKQLKKGDRVCGVVYGGAFAEYVVANGDLLIKVPDSMRFEQAATIGMGAATVGQGLYQTALKLELPNEATGSMIDRKGAYVLIYGGSSATGALGIQFAKL